MGKYGYGFLVFGMHNEVSFEMNATNFQVRLPSSSIVHDSG